MLPPNPLESNTNYVVCWLGQERYAQKIPPTQPTHLTLPTHPAQTAQTAHHAHPTHTLLSLVNIGVNAMN